MEQSLVDRVCALLEKARSSEFPAEREAYVFKAQNLISQYGIDRALIESKHGLTTIANRYYPIPSPYAREKAALLSRIGQVYRVAMVYTYGLQRCHGFGFESDLDRMELMYEHVASQVALELQRVRPTDGSNIASFRRSWLTGYGMIIQDRLLWIESRAARTVGTRTDVVLRDRSALAATERDRHYSNIMSETLTGIQPAGVRQGRAAGNKADLNARPMHPRIGAVNN